MVSIKFKRVVFALVLVLIFSFSAYFAFGRIIRGDQIVGIIIDTDGNPAENESVIISTTVLQSQCASYGGCYCNAPNCSTYAETDDNGEYSISASSLTFDSDFYCNEGGGPEVNVTQGMSCAPYPNETMLTSGYCAGSDGCINHSSEFVEAYTNKTDAMHYWAEFWDPDETRYEYYPLGLFGVCNITADVPPINGTIPDQYGELNTPWTYDLSPHMDTTINRQWRVLGVDPTFLNVTISGHVATFTPLQDKYGYDEIAFELYDTANDGGSVQEVSVYINKTIEFKKGWNLWSLPNVENSSIRHVMAPLGNGNWGCGRVGMNPYYCNTSAGDFSGSWEIIWAQKSPNDFDSFWPADYYQNIDSQDLQKIDAHYGYWIKMKEDINLTIDYS